MKRRRSSLAVTSWLLVMMMIVSTVHAGPTILRDELVEDTAVTPSLGRGYSMSTNTYQSMCLIDVVATAPSFDFDYTFQEISQEQMYSAASSNSSSGASSSSASDRGGNGWFSRRWGWS